MGPAGLWGVRETSSYTQRCLQMAELRRGSQQRPSGVCRTHTAGDPHPLGALALVPPASPPGLQAGSS